jgi:hypothetical protein
MHRSSVEQIFAKAKTAFYGKSSKLCVTRHILLF